MKILGLVIATLLASNIAFAQLVISPGVGYYSSDVESTQGITANTERTETRIDARVGYVLPMGLYLGGMYSHNNVDFGVADGTGNLMGPTVGYYSMMGFYTLLTYHIVGEFEFDASSKITGAKGPQVDVGWIFPISAYFGIGPQITWRSIEYDKVEGGGTSVDTDYKDTSIAPYVSLWFMF